ncbi:desampylase [Halobaculum limi]|uniref:desampylase n=1 Tax=Halobaculum limi TaxID=3031916 RepID=UPI0024055D65|nr:desampylase [Halobaculum sp. YSMS11]
MPADRLLLPSAVRETLHERRAAGAPQEVCGVLLGDRATDSDDETTPDVGDPLADRVVEAVAVDNVAADPERFYELDPTETVAVVEDAETRGLAVVGFYHTHPRGPASPSSVDRDRATWVGYVYCIVAPDDVVAYRWTGEQFRSLRVETP